MSLIEIEAELEKLTPDELRRLALKSWNALVQKEGRAGAVTECNEDHPRLLAALDEAIQEANANPEQGHSANAVRARLREWTSK